jgi:hypothetical protein
VQWVLTVLVSIYCMINLVYHSAEHYCLIKFNDVPVLAYFMSVTYCVPVSIILFIYLRIACYMKRTPATLHRHTAQRDIIIIRRISLIISALLLLVVPALVLSIIYWITGSKPALSYRSIYATNALDVAVFSVMILFIIPQLRAVLLKKRTIVRTIHIVGTVPIATS